LSELEFEGDEKIQGQGLDLHPWTFIGPEAKVIRLGLETLRGQNLMTTSLLVSLVEINRLSCCSRRRVCMLVTFAALSPASSSSSRIRQSHNSRDATITRAIYCVCSSSTLLKPYNSNCTVSPISPDIE